MYKRYETPKNMPSGRAEAPKPPPKKPAENFNSPHKENHSKNQPPKENQKSNNPRKNGFLAGLIPTSVYNPETGKIFGRISPDDFFIIALILLLIDKDAEENKMLILVLLYVLLSDYIDLPI